MPPTLTSSSVIHPCHQRNSHHAKACRPLSRHHLYFIHVIKGIATTPKHAANPHVIICTSSMSSKEWPPRQSMPPTLTSSSVLHPCHQRNSHHAKTCRPLSRHHLYFIHVIKGIATTPKHAAHPHVIICTSSMSSKEWPPRQSMPPTLTSSSVLHPCHQRNSHHAKAYHPASRHHLYFIHVIKGIATTPKHAANPHVIICTSSMSSKE